MQPTLAIAFALLLPGAGGLASLRGGVAQGDMPSSLKGMDAASLQALAANLKAIMPPKMLAAAMQAAKTQATKQQPIGQAVNVTKMASMKQDALATGAAMPASASPLSQLLPEGMKKQDTLAAKAAMPASASPLSQLLRTGMKVPGNGALNAPKMAKPKGAGGKLMMLMVESKLRQVFGHRRKGKSSRNATAEILEGVRMAAAQFKDVIRNDMERSGVSNPRKAARLDKAINKLQMGVEAVAKYQWPNHTSSNPSVGTAVIS